MMPFHATLLGLEIADPSIKWPAPETEFCSREGWELKEVTTQTADGPVVIEAMCNGDLAVNKMLGFDPGFTISTAATAYRISHGGRVFARCIDAMRAVEEMHAAYIGWGALDTRGFTDFEARAFGMIIDQAEARGEILLDRVYPGG